MSKKLTNILLILSAIIFLFGSGYRLGEYQANQQKIERVDYNIIKNQPQKNLDFSLFWDTWTKLEQKYVDKSKINPQKMIYYAIKGMVASVEDPYTFFLTPDENKQAKSDLEGKFEGIGAQLGLQDNKITVIAPIKDSPAESAGVRAGDVIVKVDGQSVAGWTLLQAVGKIRGKNGTKVKLTVNRKDKEKEFTITRAVINIASVELSYEAKQPETPGGIKEETGKTGQKSLTPADVAYLKLTQFGNNTNDEWDKGIEEIAKRWQAKKIKGMVLDLRDNPGGYLESAVYLGSEFLPKGDLIVKQESSSQSVENREYRVVRTGKLLDIPLVVLINKGSASASEILSGALRDHKRAKLVGEKSFGKGSVQEALDLKDNAGLHVTVAKWILPNGDWINGKGIEPDIKVENKVENGNTLTRDKDAQLERAIEEVLK